MPIRSPLGRGSLVLLLTFVAVALAHPAGAAERLPVPEASRVAEADRLIEQVFADELAQRTPEDLRAVAQRMLTEAVRAKGSPSMAFALFDRAVPLAVAGGDVAFALRVIDAAGREFELDTLAWKIDVLRNAVRALRSAEAVDSFAAGALDTIEHAIELGRLEDAAAVVPMVKPVIRRVSNLATRQNLIARTEEVAAMQDAAARAATAEKQLAANPDDPAANLAWGEYLGFHRHDWPAALPHLTQCSDDAVRAAAQRDLASNPDDVESRVAVGHAWWDLSMRETLTEAQRAGYRARAAAIYRDVIPRLGGLPRDIVRERLGEVGEIVSANRTTAPGLVARVFAGSNFDKPAHEEVHATLEHHWGRGAPHRSVDGDAFSVRWTGYLVAPESGVYRLKLTADDVASVWVNDAFVLRTGRGEAGVRLVRGLNPLKIELTESGGDAGIELQWQPPEAGQFKSIPIEVLGHDAGRP